MNIDPTFTEFQVPRFPRQLSDKRPNPSHPGADSHSVGQVNGGGNLGSWGTIGLTPDLDFQRKS